MGCSIQSFVSSYFFFTCVTLGTDGFFYRSFRLSIALVEACFVRNLLVLAVFAPD